MATTGSHDLDRSRTARDTRRAGAKGLGVAALGAVVLNVAPFMDWVQFEGTGQARVGYETDSLVPFTAYLGLGFLLALAYARKRAHRGQHRGLTLASMAVALATTVQSIAFALCPMGGLERGGGLTPEIGVYVAIVGAALWALGSGLLAKEVEGDDDTAVDLRPASARTAG